ncbi:CdaR family protein [Virgibacillus salexigens]|uniref:CdaA regulatory protein CdaR n=1 Tax=Virgibacillus kapii TaxID=1638645 RepID=A0ABQ2DTJ2_9BACI|nr:CdaR family protein [Virgibacillus kapii]GGJ72344.1 CdaA regulatory protein CdaR [Virgibacillus kapii]
MDNWFRSKWFVRVVSLAFAVLFYVFVSVEVNNAPNNADSTFPSGGDSQNLETIDEVPVDIRINNDKYVVSGVPEHVSVSMEGSLSILTPTIKNRNFNVFVDLQGLEAGNHTVELQHDIPEKLDVFIEPKRIEVTIEEKATQEFDVNIDFLHENQLAEGFELGDYEVSPQKVTITSAQSVIDKIGIVKAYVDLNGLDKSINNREVPVNVYDSQGNELNVNVQPENVVVSADINNPSKKVPISVETSGELPKGYELTSISANVEEVELFGTNHVLENIEGISTEKIDLSEITDSGTIEADLALPDGTSAKDIENVEVTVELEQTKTINALPINVESLAEGQEITFADPANSEMDITVTGNPSDIKELTDEDFRAYINVEELEVGEHDVPISVEGPEEVSVEAEFEQATIEISEPE